MFCYFSTKMSQRMFNKMSVEAATGNIESNIKDIRYERDTREAQVIVEHKELFEEDVKNKLIEDFKSNFIVHGDVKTIRVFKEDYGLLSN